MSGFAMNIIGACLAFLWGVSLFWIIAAWLHMGRERFKEIVVPLIYIFFAAAVPSMAIGMILPMVFR
jgi:hypothetical protein